MQRAKGTQCCFSMSTLNTFILLTTTSKPTTVKCKVLLCFLGNNSYAKTHNVTYLHCLSCGLTVTQRKRDRERERRKWCTRE